jgi:hypothetical protein
MEDIFWESTYPYLYQDEYFSIKQELNNLNFFKKQEIFFNNDLRLVKDKRIKSGTATKPLLKDLTLNNTSLPIFSDDYITDSTLAMFKDFNLFSNETSFDLNEDSYESLKYLNYVYYLNYKNVISSFFNGVQPISYSSVFDSFRSDYEDLYLSVDESPAHLVGMGLSTGSEVSNIDQNIRLSNPLKLRSTVKNAIVTYNAIQKVFRSRFDEGRSNARLEDFSTSYVKHPFITTPRVNYESLLGKNKEFFFKINLYNHATRPNFNNVYALSYSNNIYFNDLPFLMSMKSDPSRYLWFD